MTLSSTHVIIFIKMIFEQLFVNLPIMVLGKSFPHNQVPLCNLKALLDTFNRDHYHHTKTMTRINILAMTVALNETVILTMALTRNMTMILKDHQAKQTFNYVRTV